MLLRDEVQLPREAARVDAYRWVRAFRHSLTNCAHICSFRPHSLDARTWDNSKTDIRTVSDPIFLEKASENTLDIYQHVMWSVQQRYGPVIEVFEVEGSRERRVVIGYKMGGTKKFFSALSNLYHFYSLYSARKYVGACFRPVRLRVSSDTGCAQSNSRTGSRSSRSTSTRSLAPTRRQLSTRFSRS